jgi:mRNA interferase YafQ
VALTPVWSGRFKRDARKAQKRHTDMTKPATILTILIAEKPLPASGKDHPFKGDWLGFRDLHLEPD